jgi:hypothetical protein
MPPAHHRSCWARKLKVRVSHAVNSPQHLYSADIVSRDMDTEVRKVPLGVTSAYDLDMSFAELTDSFLPSIAPFNFPAYVLLVVVNDTYL